MKEYILIFQSDYVKVQPSINTICAIWAKQPKFDKKGRPVDYLN